MPNEDGKRSLAYTPEFKRNIRLLSRRYRHIRSDIEPVLERIQNGDTPGKQIPGVKYAVFKVRAKNSDARKGARGGYRIIYYLPTPDKAILITIYSKSDQADVSIQRLRQIIQESEH